ncbi:MAG: O-antigen polymerase [Polyangiaceae bacterium]
MATAGPVYPADAVAGSSQTEDRALEIGEREALTTEPEAAKPGLRIVVALVMIVIGVSVYVAAPVGIVQEVLPLFLTATIVQMAPLFVSRKFDPFSPACYHAMVNGISLIAIAAALFATEDVSFGGMGRLGYDERVELLNLISLAYIVQGVGYCLGYYFTGGFSLLLRLLPTFPGFRWHSRRMWLIIGGLWLVFAVAYARFQSLAQSGLFEAATAETKAVWRNEDDRMAWLFRALQLAMIPLYVLTARFLDRSVDARSRRRWIVALLFLTGTIALLAARIGQRGNAIILLICLAGIVHYVWRRIPTPVIVAAAFIAIVVTNFLGDARTGADTDDIRPATTMSQPMQVLAKLEQDRVHLAATGCAMYYFPERVDYLKGSSYLAIVLAPIPRAIWPAKNQLFPWSENAIVWILIQQPLPMPFPFVLYANFGWIGMFVGMALWGVFHKTLFKWVHQSGYAPATVVIYASALVTFTPTTSGVAWLLGAGIPLFIVMKLMRRA